MPHDPRVSILAANAQANAIGALSARGWLRFYSEEGAELAALRLGENAFQEAIDGRIYSNPIQPDTNAAGGNDAARFMVQTEDGQDVFGGSVGLENSNSDYEFKNSTYIHPGSEVHAAGLSYQAWHG